MGTGRRVRPVFDSRGGATPGTLRLRQSGPMAGRALLLRADPGFSLPAFERFAPPPAPALVAARLEAASQPGEIVLDLFGRGGWVARAAIDAQRKGISLESTPLDRLLAEIVLRPPGPAPPRRRGPGARGVGAPGDQPQDVDHRPLREPLRDLRPPGRPRRADLGRRAPGRRRTRRAAAGPQALPLSGLPRPARRRRAAPGAARRAGPRAGARPRGHRGPGAARRPVPRARRPAPTSRSSSSTSTRRASCRRSARSSSGSRRISAPRRSRRRSAWRSSTRSRPRAGSRPARGASPRCGSPRAT